MCTYHIELVCMHTRPIINHFTLWDPLGDPVVCFRQGILLIWGDLGAHMKKQICTTTSLYFLCKKGMVMKLRPESDQADVQAFVQQLILIGTST